MAAPEVYREPPSDSEGKRLKAKESNMALGEGGEGLDVPDDFKSIFRPGMRLTADYLKKNGAEDLLNGKDQITLYFSNWDTMASVFSSQLYEQAYPALTDQQKYFVLVLELIVNKQINKTDFHDNESLRLVFDGGSDGSSGTCYAMQREGNRGNLRYVATLSLPLTEEVLRSSLDEQELKEAIAWEAIRRLYPQINRLRMQMEPLANKAANSSGLDPKLQQSVESFWTFIRFIETASRQGIEQQAGITQEGTAFDAWMMIARAWDLLRSDVIEQWRMLHDKLPTPLDAMKPTLEDVLAWNGPLIDAFKSLSIVLDILNPPQEGFSSYEDTWNEHYSAAHWDQPK